MFPAVSSGRLRLPFLFPFARRTPLSISAFGPRFGVSIEVGPPLIRRNFHIADLPVAQTQNDQRLYLHVHILLYGAVSCGESRRGGISRERILVGTRPEDPHVHHPKNRHRLPAGRPGKSGRRHFVLALFDLSLPIIRWGGGLLICRTALNGSATPTLRPAAYRKETPTPSVCGRSNPGYSIPLPFRSASAPAASRSFSR